MYKSNAYLQTSRKALANALSLMLGGVNSRCWRAQKLELRLNRICRTMCAWLHNL